MPYIYKIFLQDIIENFFIKWTKSVHFLLIAYTQERDSATKVKGGIGDLVLSPSIDSFGNVICQMFICAFVKVNI